MSTSLHALAEICADTDKRASPSSQLSQSYALDLAIAEDKKRMEDKRREEAAQKEALEAIKAVEIGAAADAAEAAEAAKAVDKAKKAADKAEKAADKAEKAAVKLVKASDKAEKAKRKSSERSPDTEMEEFSDSDSEWRDKSSRYKKKKSKSKKSERRKKDKAKLSEFSGSFLSGLLSPKTKIRYSSIIIDEFGQFQNKEILKLMALKTAEFERLKLAAKEKNPGALLDLATCYRYGYCKLTVDFDMAFDCLQSVATSSNRDCALIAKWVLNEYYFDNLSVQTQSLPEADRRAQALKYLKETANGGLAVAINDLGYYYETTENLPEAMLAELLGPQQGPKTPDEIRHLRNQKAYELYEKAAKLKLNHAEYNLSQCFHREGFYVPEKFNNKEDRKKREQYWLLRAANNRYQQAIDNLAARYPETYAKCFYKNKNQKENAEKASESATSATDSVSLLDKEPTQKRKRGSKASISTYKHKKRKVLGKNGDEQEAALPGIEEHLKKLTSELHMDLSEPVLTPSSSDKSDKSDKSPEKSRVAGIPAELPSLLSLSGLSSMSSKPSLQELLALKITAISKDQLKQIERLKALGSELEKENSEDEKAIKELEVQIAKLGGNLSLEGSGIQKDIVTRKFA